MTGSDTAMVELIRLNKAFGSEQAVREVSLVVRRGEFVTLLGPSGCGKTTTLRCIAGLERPDAGQIRIGGDLVAAPGRGIFVNPEQRNIGMVFQSYAVWPHMTVFDNVAYGLRARRAPAAVVAQRTRRALDLVGLGHLAQRYATKLSGGQRQRIALARAIVYEPRVVLFDEPLSNLDARLREQMRVELVRLQHEVGITSVYVTHDQTEALTMSDRVVVMDKGVIQQVDDPRTIYLRPANTFVAKFIGAANLLPAILNRRSGALCELTIEPGDARPPVTVRATGADNAKTGQAVVLSVRPEDIEIHLGPPQAGAAGNLLVGEIIDTVYLGCMMGCRVRVGRFELGVQIDQDERFARGQEVHLSFAPDHGLCLIE